MTKLTTLALSLSLAFSVPGIAAAYDCVNAPDDIKRLQAEKDSTAARALKGFSAIMPIGIVVHSVAGNEQDTLNEMSTNQHNEQLDARISQIKAHCKLQ